MPEHMHWSRQCRPQLKAFRTASGYWLHWRLSGDAGETSRETSYKHSQLKTCRPANCNSHNKAVQDTLVVSAASRWATGGHGWYHWPTPAMCRWVNCTWKTNFEVFQGDVTWHVKTWPGFYRLWGLVPCILFRWSKFATYLWSCSTQKALAQASIMVEYGLIKSSLQCWAIPTERSPTGLSESLNSVISQFTSLIKTTWISLHFSLPKISPPFGNFFPTFCLSKGQPMVKLSQLLAPRPWSAMCHPRRTISCPKCSCPPAANVLRRPVRRPYDETGMWILIKVYKSVSSECEEHMSSNLG